MKPVAPRNWRLTVPKLKKGGVGPTSPWQGPRSLAPDRPTAATVAKRKARITLVKL